LSAARFLAVLLCLFLIAFAVPAAAEEAIEAFTANITVSREGMVHVAETIQVRAEGDQIRRGIYRDISTTFEDAEGSVRRVGFDLLGVTRDGEPEPYHIERHSDFLRIYAGAEEVFLEPGNYTYVFTYETDRQIRWFDGKPELFWNVTGNDWRFPIRNASVSLTLPDAAAPVRWDAYTGGVGERGTDFDGAVGDNNVLAVRATRELVPGEGLTFVAEIPADAVDQPDASASSACFWCSSITSSPGIASAATRSAAPSSRSSILRMACRRRSPTTSRTGASPARPGGP
jgi:hypothetical protein